MHARHSSARAKLNDATLEGVRDRTLPGVKEMINLSVKHFAFLYLEERNEEQKAPLSPDTAGERT